MNTAATRFFNALIVRFRASMPTGAQPTGIEHVHVRARPMVDPVLIPAYRRRRLPRRSAHMARALTSLIP
jgi:hypothetical protein